MEEQPVVDPAVISAGLAGVRKRRWLMWLTILAYMPVMVTTLKISSSMNVTATVFVIWFVVLFVVTLIYATAKCPQCGKYFHMNGMTLLFMRKCLHCQLHVTSDKKPGHAPPK